MYAIDQDTAGSLGLAERMSFCRNRMARMLNMPYKFDLSGREIYVQRIESVHIITYYKSDVNPDIHI
jgi:hypothetical protein